MPREAGPSRPRSFRESITCALRGTHFAARTEPHFRVHLVIAMCALLAAAWAGLAAVELGVLALTIAVVFVSELVNTAIEMLTDLLHPGEGRRAAALKDVSAAAVLMASGLAAAVGAVLFLPHLTTSAPVLSRSIALILAAVLLAIFLAGAVRSRSDRSARTPMV